MSKSPSNYVQAKSPFKVGHPRKDEPRAILQNPAIRALRAEAVIKARAQGKTMKELAHHYRCSEQTLYNLIKWAKTEGLLGELRARVVDEIAPLAINAYKDALEADTTQLSGNQIKAHKMKVSAAKDVAGGIGIFQKHSKSESITEEYSLKAYYEKRSQQGLSFGEQTSTEGETAPLEFIDSTEVDLPLLSERNESENGFGGFSEPLDLGGCDFPIVPDDGGPEKE